MSTLINETIDIAQNIEQNLREISYGTAINEAQDIAMSRDDKVFVFGLDVDDHLGIQGTTLGLKEKYGSNRVFGTPLSEDAMTGIAIGAAMAGYRPVHVHIRMDFMLLAMNQIINMAAKAHYMYGGQVKVPMVMRTIIGRSWGQGPQHSQALHSLFAHIPGLKVVAPSTAHDAKGALIASIEDNNPVIFMEQRFLYNMKGYVPEGYYKIELGKAHKIKQGNDITIVGISYGVVEALRAANYLSKAGISAEVIDPITIQPLDMDSIILSLAKTKNLVIVDNGWTNFGVSAEIMARAYESGIENIKVKRIGFVNTTCPTTRVLEDLFYPNAINIAKISYDMLNADSNYSWLPNELDNKELSDFKGPF